MLGLESESDGKLMASELFLVPVLDVDGWLVVFIIRRGIDVLWSHFAYIFKSRKSETRQTKGEAGPTVLYVLYSKCGDRVTKRYCSSGISETA